MFQLQRTRKKLLFFLPFLEHLIICFNLQMLRKNIYFSYYKCFVV